jgi:hypothetical protein
MRIETMGHVDPRLLEQTDEPAPESAAERAKLYHTFTPFAEKYPVFVWCRLLAHGGYSAKFTSQGGQSGVIHYFDSNGHFITSEKYIIF